LDVANGTEFKNKVTADPNWSYTLTADIGHGQAALQVRGETQIKKVSAADRPGRKPSLFAARIR